MAGELILWVKPVQFEHLTIAVLLGQYRRGRNAGFRLVAAHDRAQPVAAEIWQAIAVDQHLSRFTREPHYRAFHRQQAGLQDINVVHLPMARFGDGPGDCLELDLVFQRFALPRREFLRIGQSADARGVVENHGGRDHRTGQGPATGFVDPGYKHRQWGFMHI